MRLTVTFNTGMPEIANDMIIPPREGPEAYLTCIKPVLVPNQSIERIPSVEEAVRANYTEIFIQDLKETQHQFTVHIPYKAMRHLIVATQQPRHPLFKERLDMSFEGAVLQQDYAYEWILRRPGKLGGSSYLSVKKRQEGFSSVFARLESLS